MTRTLTHAASSAQRPTLTTTTRPEQETPRPLGPRLVAEFIGTFFLVLTVCIATSPKHGAGALAPIAIGSVLMVMVFAGGHISGGHYNPAVSTAVLIRGKLGLTDWFRYVTVQLTAAAAGGLLARALDGPGHAFALGGTWKILAVEFIFTFALAYVVLNVATSKATDGNSYFGLAIGFTVVAGAFAVGGISGGAFNPAVALGASLLGTFTWDHYWIYVIATLLGGAAAAQAFLYMQPAERVQPQSIGRTS